MDEASAFKASNGNTDNADACYKVLRTSANSRFGLKFRWIGIIISFPRRQVGDFTYDKWKQAASNPAFYADKAAHWEVNPNFDPTHPFYAGDIEWVTLEDHNLRVPKVFEDEFVADPTDAKTKYMCEPPPQEGGFFEVPRRIQESVNPHLPKVTYVDTVSEREVIRTTPLGEEERVVVKWVHKQVSELPPRIAGRKYFAHGDPGLTNDAFALCVAHREPESKVVMGLDGTEKEVSKVVVDFILSWVPKADMPVDLANVHEVLLRCCRHYNIEAVTFDRWNSAQGIQNLITEGFYAEDKSFSAAQQLAMYRNLKLLVYNGLIELPDDDVLVEELQFLKVVNGKIAHDVRGKDRADACAAAALLASGEGLSETDRMIQETLGNVKPKERANAASALVPFSH